MNPDSTMPRLDATLRALIAIVLVLAIVVGLLWWLAPVLTPFLAAGLLAYLLDPVVRGLQCLGRGRVSRTAAVAGLFLLALLVVVLFFVWLVPIVFSQLEGLVRQVPQWVDGIRERLLPWLETRFGTVPLPAGEDLKSLVEKHWETAGGAAGAVLGWLTRSGSTLLLLAMNLVLIPVVLFYLLIDWPRIVKGARNLLPQHVAPTIETFVARSDDMLGHFLRGQLTVMLVLSVFYAVTLTVVGLELGIAIGVVAGLVSFIPYVGVITGLVLATAAALFQGDGWVLLALVWGVFVTAQLLEQMVLTPKLVGDRTGLHPVAVIFAVLAGGSLFGFFGVLLALPVAAVIAVAWSMLMQWYRSASFGPAPQAPDAGEDSEHRGHDNAAESPRPSRPDAS